MFCCFDVFLERPPQKYQVQAKLSTIRPVFLVFVFTTHLSVHLKETHRITSNFDMCLLNFISTCHFCFIQKIIYYLKRNWPRFSLPKFCRSSIYAITIVKVNNRPIQNLLNFPQRTSMDFCKVRFL